MLYVESIINQADLLYTTFQVHPSIFDWVLARKTKLQGMKSLKVEKVVRRSSRIFERVDIVEPQKKQHLIQGIWTPCTSEPLLRASPCAFRSQPCVFVRENGYWRPENRGKCRNRTCKSTHLTFLLSVDEWCSDRRIVLNYILHSADNGSIAQWSSLPVSMRRISNEIIFWKMGRKS